MALSQMTELEAFLSTYIAEVDADSDASAIEAFLKSSRAKSLPAVIAQLKTLQATEGLSLADLGTASNRWFGDEEEAQAWLISLLLGLERAAGGGGSAEGVVVKDSNGAVLSEGDSVTVIKDLKVKGGSSDLKRGTMIKKIHLVGDPDVIECRVDGSTLVLKTCFLKKA